MQCRKGRLQCLNVIGRSSAVTSVCVPFGFLQLTLLRRLCPVRASIVVRVVRRFRPVGQLRPATRAARTRRKAAGLVRLLARRAIDVEIVHVVCGQRVRGRGRRNWRGAGQGCFGRGQLSVPLLPALGLGGVGLWRVSEELVNQRGHGL